MSKIIFGNEEFDALAEETVLDCLLRSGVEITNSCRNGICQSCLLKTNSAINSSSQKGLSIAKKESGYFLSCQQKINSTMEVFKPDTTTWIKEGVITSQQRISSSVVIVKIKPSEEYRFRAGQFINIIRGDGTCRSYSIASNTGSPELEFHVRKVPNGSMSNWFYDESLEGQNISFSEALGECYLTPDMSEKELLLIGVGTGLAPLYGVLQDRMINGSTKKTSLLHAGMTIENLYMTETLKNLEEQNDHLSYSPVYLKGEKREGFQKGDLNELVQKLEYDFANTIVMVCGDPALVKNLKQTVFMAGVPSKNILSDPFISNTTQLN